MDLEQKTLLIYSKMQCFFMSNILNTIELEQSSLLFNFVICPWQFVICSESKEQVERSLERWRYALERRGMKVSRRKTEYMCVNERGDGETVLLQGLEVPKVKGFRYLGSTVQCNVGCGSEVKRVQASWNNWRRVSGVICNKRLSACVKGKVYKMVVRPAMLYGLETVPLTKKQEAELAVAELKMLRFSLGVTRMDKKLRMSLFEGLLM